jgi:hypothetical protein
MFYIDVCGPMSISSINGNRWLCIVVDDVSRLPFLFFMKNKDNAATYIKEYVKMINTQQLGGIKVQQMYSNSSGEFINKDLDKFLKRLDNIEDDLTNWTSSDEWMFTATSVKKKQHNTEFAASEEKGRSQISFMT